MRFFCLICARKNSKGLPNKNIKKIFGKPLISYTLRFAKELKIFDGIYVSSDSEEINKISLKENINFDLRPKYLSKNITPELSVWKYFLNKMIKKSHISINDVLVVLPCTAPLRRKIDIVNMMNFFKKNKPNGIVAITQSRKNPYFNMVKINKSKNIFKFLKTKNIISRRQDAPKVFEITTNCYIFKNKYILKTNNIFSGNIKGFEVPYHTTLDIDNKFDFNLAKKLIKKPNE